MHAGEVIAQVEEMQFPQPHINTQYRVNQCQSLHNVSMHNVALQLYQSRFNENGKPSVLQQSQAGFY